MENTGPSDTNDANRMTNQVPNVAQLLARYAGTPSLISATGNPQRGSNLVQPTLNGMDRLSSSTSFNETIFQNASSSSSELLQSDLPQSISQLQEKVQAMLLKERVEDNNNNNNNNNNNRLFHHNQERVQANAAQTSHVARRNTTNDNGKFYSPFLAQVEQPVQSTGTLFNFTNAYERGSAQGNKIVEISSRTIPNLSQNLASNLAPSRALNAPFSWSHPTTSYDVEPRTRPQNPFSASFQQDYRSTFHSEYRPHVEAQKYNSYQISTSEIWQKYPNVELLPHNLGNKFDTDSKQHIIQDRNALLFLHSFDNSFATGSQKHDCKSPNQRMSQFDASGIRENCPKADVAGSPYSKPCDAHPKYPARVFCKNHHMTVCCACAMKTIRGPHSTCNLLPKRSVLPDSQTRLQASKKVDSLAQRLEIKLKECGMSNVLVRNPNHHLAFDISLQSRCNFRMSPALSDFMNDVNYLIENLSTCHRRDLEALVSKITNCCTQFERLPDFQEKLPPYLPNCSLYGQGIDYAYKCGTNVFFVSVRNKKNMPCYISETELEVFVRRHDEDQNVHVEPYYMPGVYKVTYNCSYYGFCDITVKISGQSLPGCPFKIWLEPEHGFSPRAEMAYSIGDDLNFNKPWGVCIDNQGNYIIADRCNNCVKVFSDQWKFKWCFPEEGTPISLKKPTGVAIDHNGHLVVTDKDNHRVQVFTVSGHPLRRTSSSDTFNFPWGIAVNSQNQYIVTHSKCRVKILTSNLETLHEIPIGSFNFELNPRAVAIGYMDEILITEFEGGNVYTLDVNTYKFRLMTRNHPGALNQAPGVKRYQGIAVDRDGFILVCDSRNRCVEVHNYAGDFIDKWTVPGKPVFILPLNTVPKSYLVVLEEGFTSLVGYTLGVDFDEELLELLS